MREIDENGLTATDKIIKAHLNEYGYKVARLFPPIGNSLKIVNDDGNFVCFNDSDISAFQDPSELRTAMEGIFKYEYEFNKLGISPHTPPNLVKRG